MNPATGYLWPTDASNFLTSVFGESRARRFHTGIDIKTWGRVGYNVYAIRDGYVWRVNVSPYGYGKVLYLKLDTGETAVYAHLSGFVDKIQAQVAAEQRRRGRYRVDLYFEPNDLPVRAGDVVAFTGQTGIGAPHLHFEIRETGNHTLNPLSKYADLPDRISPAVTKVSFTPLDARSEVDGDFRPLILEPQWIRPGEYDLLQPVSIWGNIGVAVSAFDKDSNSANLFGVYRLKLFVDGELRFEYQFDDLSFDENTMIDLERDYRLSSRKLGGFHKLYKDPRNTRSGYRPNRPWAGVLRSESLAANPRLRSKAGRSLPDAGPEIGGLLPGTHDLRIEVADFVGNTSVVSGRFEVGAAYKIQATITQDEAGHRTLHDVVTFDLRRIERV
ncbi:MAG TPA: M23 family metallopeptidase, partial [bacterium]